MNDSSQTQSRSGVRWLVVGTAALLGVAVGAVLTSASGSDGSSSFVPTTPCRLMDTRSTSQVGPRGTPIGAGELYSATVWGTNGNCVIPSSATAVSLNVTFVSPTSAGFVAVFPPDKPNPGTSNLNFVAGQAPAPNGVTSPLSFDGKIGFYNEAGTVNLIADIVGYYEQAGSAPGGLVAGNCSTLVRRDLPECKNATFNAGAAPRFMAFDGTSLWVVNQNSDTVSKTNPVTGTMVDFPTGIEPFGVAFDGTSIWVANSGDDDVSRINPATGTKVDYPVGDFPFGVAFDGSSIWVTNFEDDTVTRINRFTGTTTGTFPTEDGPREIAFDGTNIWISNSLDGTVSKMNPETGTRTDIAVGVDPRGLAFDGTNIWVVNSGDDDVSRINAVTEAKTDFPTGLTPQAAAFDGTHIWVTNLDGYTVSKFIPATGTSTQIPTEILPLGIAFDGSNIWITHVGIDKLSRLVP